MKKLSVLVLFTLLLPSTLAAFGGVDTGGGGFVMTKTKKVSMLELKKIEKTKMIKDVKKIVLKK